MFVKMLVKLSIKFFDNDIKYNNDENKTHIKTYNNCKWKYNIGFNYNIVIVIVIKVS